MADSKLILIIEDEASIADTLTYALDTAGFKTQTCRTGQEGLDSFKLCNPVLVVLDVGLPDILGFDVCREIRKSSNIPIIFLTSRAEEVDRILGLELGGDDYVTKPFSPREFVSRIKAVLRRTEDSGLPVPAPKRNSKFEIDEERLKILFRGTALDLSRYEFRILSILVKRPGRVYSREALMSIAWESPEMSLERTIDTHIKAIRAKLRQIDPQDDSIITQRGFGYSLREE